MPNGEPLESLDPVEQLVATEMDFQWTHFESLDTKAGIVLGLSAALVALTINGAGGASSAGRTLTVAATVFAALALLFLAVMTLGGGTVVERVGGGM